MVSLTLRVILPYKYPLTTQVGRNCSNMSVFFLHLIIFVTCKYFSPYLNYSCQYRSYQVKTTPSPTYIVSNDITHKYALTLNKTSGSYQDELHYKCHRTTQTSLSKHPTLKGNSSSIRVLYTFHVLQYNQSQ